MIRSDGLASKSTQHCFLPSFLPASQSRGTDCCPIPNQTHTYTLLHCVHMCVVEIGAREEEGGLHWGSSRYNTPTSECPPNKDTKRNMREGLRASHFTVSEREGKKHNKRVTTVP